MEKKLAHFVSTLMGRSIDGFFEGSIDGSEKNERI